jgi:hypothetical protein
LFPALIGAALAAGCRQAPVQVTSLRITTTWTDVAVDQLEFTVTDDQGTNIVEPTRRPLTPRMLESASDVVIYFEDRRGGTDVVCEVHAYLAGHVVGTGQAKAHLIARTLVETRINLVAGPGSKVDGATCQASAECLSQYCADGVCCQTECAGACRSCAVPGKEGACTLVPEGIKHSACADQGAETCGFDGTCDGLGACRRHPAGTRCAPGYCNGSSVVAAGACDGEGKCVMGPVLTCAPFNCNSSGATASCFSSCTAAAQCVPGRECLNGSCGKKLNGAACALGTECVSGYCVDGVCCEGKCDGPCLSCAQVGAVGTCRAVAKGVKDPRNMCPDEGAPSCGRDGTCDGAGGCARYSAATVCKPSTCKSTTIQITAGRCDGMGTCVEGGELACSPFACSATTGACNSTCTRTEDCAPGIVCMLDQHSCGKKGLGQPCGVPAECASGYCVDKVCCQDSCQGACRSCTLGAIPGVCTLAGPGAPDPRAACKDQGKASCGTDGTCTGDGFCHRYAAGTVCTQGTCDGATNARTLPSTCDGKGTCTGGAMVSCGAYRCNGSVCFAGCSSDADCVPPNTCLSGACGLRGNGAPCTKPSDCAPPYTCIGSTCQLLQLGSACTADAECGSGQCTEGVCCELDSCGTCRSCKVSGFVGFCHGLTAGTADARCAMAAASTCGHDGTCDGSGNCRFYAPGTQCAPAMCSGRDRIKPKTCDGAGVCKDNGTTDCSPYVCNPATNDCYRSCTTEAQCCCGNRCRGSNSCF